MAFALGGDLATLDQKIRQITNLITHLPKRRFILVGDSGEKDPEVYRAIKRLFPNQVEKILIRDVLGERLSGMERITGDDVAVFEGVEVETAPADGSIENHLAPQGDPFSRHIASAPSGCHPGPRVASRPRAGS